MALDARGSAFSTVLTREQIESLPGRSRRDGSGLKAMAPPGSTIRVDGFTGGKLPPKSQIRSIRLPRMDMFAAQNHGGMGGAHVHRHHDDARRRPDARQHGLQLRSTTR